MITIDGTEDVSADVSTENLRYELRKMWWKYPTTKLDLDHVLRNISLSKKFNIKDQKVENTVRLVIRDGWIIHVEIFLLDKHLKSLRRDP